LVIRFQYAFLAAQRLGNRSTEDIIEDVLEHLAGAQAILQRIWGQAEWNQRSQNITQLADLGPAAAILPAERGQDSLSSLSGSEVEAVIEELGRRRLNEIQRQLLLGAITELWVDYLTRVEALRVSIGLEAYAQRDPLVQYKTQASEMFQTLLADIRALVISRIFAYQPRQLSPMPIGVVESPVPAASAAQPSQAGKKKKRKRH